MNKSPEEIKKILNDSFKESKKYEKEDFELVIQNAFISSEIKKQKRMKSKIDLDSSSNQISNLKNDITLNFLESSFIVGRTYFNLIYKKLILSLFVFISLSFFAYGIAFGFLSGGATENQFIQIIISSTIYYTMFLIPILFFVYWGVADWIVSLRRDNLISRFKLKGVSKIQFIYLTIIFTLGISIVLFIFIWFIWLNLLTNFALSLGSHHDTFFLKDKISTFLVMLNFIFYSLGVTLLSIFVGFRINEQKYLTLSVFAILLCTLLFYFLDIRVYKGIQYNYWDNTPFFINIYAMIKFLNPIYSLGSNLLTSLTPHLNNFDKVFPGLYNSNLLIVINVLVILTIISTILIFNFYSEWIIKYRAMR